jgi:hypothetical protein
MVPYLFQFCQESQGTGDTILCYVLKNTETGHGRLTAGKAAVRIIRFLANPDTTITLYYPFSPKPT